MKSGNPGIMKKSMIQMTESIIEKIKTIFDQDIVKIIINMVILFSKIE